MQWKELTTEQQKVLLRGATAIDGRTGNNATNDGEWIIDLSNGLSVLATITDGWIHVSPEAILYDPTV